MTDDERIDEIIRNAASDYNRPPATPKDEMWNAIQSAQKSAGPKLHVTAGGASRSASNDGYRTAARFSPKVMWLGVAAAAAILLATGVGIGRLTNTSGQRTAQQQDTVIQVVDAPSNTPVLPPDEVGPSPAPEVQTPSPGKAPARNVQPANRARSREDIRRNPQILGGGGTIPRNFGAVPQNQSNGLATSPVNTTYQVATQRHLANAEALLTSFSMGTRDARMDAQFAVWAKGLLSNTRLLLDSPAGDDPRRARLLQDLELVLAQIVQLSPNALAQDRELIQGSIQSENVMTRLRTAIPAGQPREITER